jgi:hypothetical protein
LAYDVTSDVDAQAVTARVDEKVRTEARVAEAGKPAPIVEIRLNGQLGFPNSLLEMQRMRDEARAITGALHVRIKNHTVPLTISICPRRLRTLAASSLNDG